MHPLAIYQDLPKQRSAEEEARNPAQTITIGNAGRQSKDKSAVEVSNELAGINKVQLNINDYAETVKREEPLTLMQAAPGLPRPFSTLGVHITIGDQPTELAYGKALPEGTAARLEGLAAKKAAGTITAAESQELAQIAATISAGNSTNLLDSQAVWKIKPQQPGSADVSMAMEFDAGHAPVAEVIKTFHVDPNSYEVTITHTVRNLRPLHSVTKPAGDKVITLGETNVSNVTVKVGEQTKAPGTDYTVDAAKGLVMVTPGGSIQTTDQLAIAFHTPADALHVMIEQLGPGELSRDDPQTDDRYFHAVKLSSGQKLVDTDHPFSVMHLGLQKAVAGTKNEKTGAMENVGTATVGEKDGQFWDFSKNPCLWVGSANRFFAAVARPLPATGDTATFTLTGEHPIPEPTHIGWAYVDLLRLGDNPANDVAMVRLAGRTVEVPAGGSVDEPLAVFFGPKKREIIQGSLTAPVGSQEYNHAVYKYISLIQYQQGCYSYCVSDWVVSPILWLLNFLKNTIALGNWGVAIMILVIVVRALLHPLTRASQVNMAKMGKQMRDVQPQMEAMKKKYADNKKKQSEEMMRIYRENKINPAGGVMGCLPMLIQMPIWAALYSGLRMDIDLRHAPFIPGWINDLSTPDTILPSSVVLLGHPWFTIPFLGWEVYGLNLLPLLLAGVFYFQMKVTTATQPKPADEQQAQMAKMSQYMIFMFPLFLYNAPSGLNLYIFASTMGGLLDTYIVRKALKKQGILAPSASLLPTHEDADGK